MRLRRHGALISCGLLERFSLNHQIFYLINFDSNFAYCLMCELAAQLILTPISASDSLLNELRKESTIVVSFWSNMSYSHPKESTFVVFFGLSKWGYIVTIFIGREYEMGRLRDLFDKSSASLIVIKGRRRIGKSRLLSEFAKKCNKAYIFSGLPVTKNTTACSQREEFRRQLGREIGIRGISADDWGDLFWHLSQQTEEGQVLIVFDEITWMGCLDSEFLGQIKNAWDLYFSQNQKLILALSGSMSAWIEENILSSTGFLGRDSLTLTLRELPLDVCKEFWTTSGVNATPYEMLRYLAVTGGVPRYLEEMNPKLSAEENIKRLAFVEGEILFREFDKIFSDLFSTRNKLYREIISTLASGRKTQGQIADMLDYKSQSEIGEYLYELEQSGFVSRNFTWSINTGKESNLSDYRLCDNYSRFYLKYILPNKTKISRGVYRDSSITSLPSWAGIMGLQVENLVLNNHKKIKALLNIQPEEIEIDGPFFQRKTQRHAGCQIDYMIQTSARTLYIIEIKFSRNTVGMQVVEEVKEKIERLMTPKQYFCRPVLIHVNGVSDELIDSNYFSHIIDMAELFE